jgi:hypothetical protein
MKRLRKHAGDERGTTLVELMVGLAAGLVVFAALTTLVLLTLNTTSRVSARVNATQTARLTLTRVIDQLHSACIAPKVPPIRAGSSSSELQFIHATGSAVSPVPTLTKITYSAGTLTQRDYAWKSGTVPLWAFDEASPVRTVVLSDRVAPITGKPIFSYFGNEGGSLTTLTPETLVNGVLTLGTAKAPKVIQVTMMFKALPVRGKLEDATPARIQGSASLRLTATSYSPTAPATPCQ